MKTRSPAWVKEDPFGIEFVEVRLHHDRLSAAGVAVGTEPSPYRLDYRLTTARRFITLRLLVTARGEGWRRRLDLRRSRQGVWTIVSDVEGDAPLSPPGGDPGALTGALDCDLGLSPFTNTMPVLRHNLLSGGGAADFRMAWVSVPDLSVRSTAQRYTALSHEKGKHVIRFEDESGFTADLTFDRDGLVLDYPGLARRLDGRFGASDRAGQ